MKRSTRLNTINGLVKLSLGGMLAATFWIALNAVAADGQSLYVENACASCHGPTGDEPILSTYPKIAGQNKEYLIRQMNDIKSGERDNGASIAMRGLVTNLDADDIIAIAEYLSSL